MDPFTLAGKRGLVVGIANDKSIAYGCAKAFAQRGASLAITYLNEKAKPHVRPLAEQLNADIIAPCNVSNTGELEAVFDQVRKSWGRLDFLVHAIAYARKEDLHGRLVDCSEEGFASALAISCHSFIRMARLAEPLMPDGGSLITLTFLGSERAVKGYGIMGPIKAALESTVKYLASELGSKHVRVNALSLGPIQTRAASGIPDFDALKDSIARRSFLGAPITIEDAGNAAAFLASAASRAVTGSIYYVDGGFHCSG